MLWLPAALTPGKFIFAEPSNDTPPIVLAVASFVAVAALPVQEADDPVTEIPQDPVAPVPVVGTIVPETRVTFASGRVSVLFAVGSPVMTS